MMFDPIQSNFNYIETEGKTFFTESHVDIIIKIIKDEKDL